MGYSKNPISLEQIRPQLSELEQGLACEWEVEPGQEDWWAYQVRQALYIARLYPTRFPALAMIADSFKVSIVKSGLVAAGPASNTAAPKARRTRTTTHGLDTDPRSGRTGNRAATLGPQTAETIIQAWFDTQPSNTAIHFPDAALDRENLLRLHRWAEGQGLIFFESLGALTLQRPTADLAGLGWDPSDLREDDEPQPWETAPD